MMKTVLCEPDIVNFTKSFKSIGYNHYTAILDLIDNSVSAGATKIWIDYISDKKGCFQTIVADNGVGMKKSDIIAAMRIASADPTSIRSGKDLGKFGLGLKLASFSQTDKFMVVSKYKEENINAFIWDLNFVRKNGKWLLQEVENINFIRPKNQGTEVILFDVFAGIDINEEQVFSKLRTHIAVAYSLKKGIRFYINDKEIDLIDPFFLNNLASNHSSIEKVFIENICIKIQSHQIPHSNKLKPKEKRIYSELNEIGMGPGLYFYRKERLIAWSGWEGLGKNLRINDLYRMSIFCEADSDWLFNIEVKKSQISITDSRLRNILKSSIINFTDIARKPYQKRAQLSLKDMSDIWILEKNNNSDKVLFTLNRKSESVKQLEQKKVKVSEFLKMIEDTIPYESLLYYLNLNKVDNSTLDLKKLETAKLMLELKLITEIEYNKIVTKYEY